MHEMRSDGRRRTIALVQLPDMTEVEGASHVVMISHPREAADVVMTAVRACAVQPAGPAGVACRGWTSSWLR
jgi:hypothetical protein